jgi:hypothetical protein
VSFICEAPGYYSGGEEAWIQSNFSFDVKLVKPSLQEGRNRKGKKYIVITNKVSKRVELVDDYVQPPTQK